MASTVVQRIRHWREIRRVEAALSAMPQPESPELHAISPCTAIWKLRLPGREECFVSVEAHERIVKGYVVHVHAEAFYLAMLRGAKALRTASYGCSVMARDAMRYDYKYDSMNTKMVKSREQPVSLPHPVVMQDGKGRPFIRFKNGITRTYWLLSNRCAAFPALVRGHEQARALLSVAGLCAVSVEDLFSRSPDAGATLCSEERLYPR